ncbi:UPF0158 family protein, partial [Planctomycetes bacterium CA13]|uniref:UPF0158 family protein n=1 Tax=Novipirellula herctigrandis TaxID=2527986 RepID=UPI0011B4D3E8
MNRTDVVFNFSTIEMAFDYANFDDGSNDAYLDRHTGEAIYFSTLGDSDEEPDDLDDTSRYVALPDSRDLSLGSRLAIDFASDIAPHLLDDVRDIFGRRGAFRRFKDMLDKHDLLDSWHKYETDREREALLRWCDENNVRYTINEDQDG